VLGTLLHEAAHGLAHAARSATPAVKAAATAAEAAMKEGSDDSDQAVGGAEEGQQRVTSARERARLAKRRELAAYERAIQRPRDSNADQPTIAEILAAYIRSHAPWPPALPGQYIADALIDDVPALQYRAPDVHAAFIALVRGAVANVVHLDLSNTDLRHARCPVGANLRNAWLYGTNLASAELVRANLAGAELAGADLSSAEGMSFPLSFHRSVLEPTEPYWLDERSDLTCKDSTRQRWTVRGVNGGRKLTPWRRVKTDPSVVMIIARRWWPRGRGRGRGP
jgi:hypothetical protein